MTARYELEADAHGLPVRYPATPDTREDASGWYPTHTAAEEAVLDAEHALWDAMDAARKAPPTSADLAARARRGLALAVAADDAGDPDLAERRRARALIDRRCASLAGCGGAR